MRTFQCLLAVVLLAVARAQAGEGATAVATLTAGFVTAITVTHGGSGYLAEPSVVIAGGGGSGATAKAILQGDKVSAIVVLTAGSGYTTVPTVAIEAAPKALGLRLDPVFKLTVEGPAGNPALVEWAGDVAGPWTTWTNVLVNAAGTVLLDLSAAPVRRFYRVVPDPRPVGPPGFVWIPPGTFIMGSPEDEGDRSADERQHPVTLTQGFWMSDHEVTQAEYQAVMNANPSGMKSDARRPVTLVSWDEAVSYCQRLTQRDRADGRINPGQAYRLPTEAEWEYAARAGSTAARYGVLDDIAWWPGNSGDIIHPVKQKAPNAWGLYDMIGNVAEWCSDWYAEYPSGSVTDPTGPSTGTERVCRGDSYRFTNYHIPPNDGPRLGRAADRHRAAPSTFRNSVLGFRIALSPIQ